MTLSHNETKLLIELILKSDKAETRKLLHITLDSMGRKEGEFYSGIIEYGPSMKFTSDQWFELLCRLPNRILRSQLNIQNILSEKHINQLPPITG